MNLAISKSDIFSFLSESTIINSLDNISNFDERIFIIEFGKFIIERFSTIRIIGEIERKEGIETFEFLEKILKENISFEDNFRNNDKYFRAILSLYLVWAGIFKYGKESGHEFWPQIFKGLNLNLPNNYSSIIGKLFLKTLKENNLELFKEVAQDGNRYVNLILLHGLIPEKHIETFIEKIIIFYITEKPQNDLSGKTILEQAKQEYLNNPIFPKPIKRFLEYGYPINYDIIDRFLNLVDEWDKNNQEFKYLYRLPAYMVDAFKTILLKQKEKELIIKSKKAKQKIKIDVYIENNVFLKIENFNINIIKKILINDIPVDELDDIINLEPEEKWKIEIICKNEEKIEKEINGFYSECLNILIFDSTTNKLITNDKLKKIPENIIIVYHEFDEIEIKNADILNDPLDLFGSWNEWKLIYLSNVNETTTIIFNNKEYLLFKPSFQLQLPKLILSQKTPHWIQSENENYPIFLDYNDIKLKFDKNLYIKWKNRKCRIVNLTNNEKNKLFYGTNINFEEFQEDIIGKIADIEYLEPGLNKIIIDNPLGLEEFEYYFIYLPLKNPIRKNFNNEILFSFEIDRKLIDNIRYLSNIKLNNSEIEIFSHKEKSDEAFCYINFFKKNKIKIYLAKTDLRFCTKSIDNPVKWDNWKINKETFPIQKFDEMENHQVLVEIDNPQIQNLDIFLKTNEKILMYDRMTIIKKLHNKVRFLFNLKKFCNHLKDLKDDIFQANVYIKYLNVEKNILTLLRFPKFDNLSINIVNISNNSEELEIDWEFKKNEPLKNRIVNFFPITDQNKITEKIIEDNLKPPIKFKLEKVKQPEIWGCNIEIKEGIFNKKDISQIHGKWLRLPDFCCIIFHDYPSYLIFEKFNILKELPLNTLINNYPWLAFLRIFYGINISSYRENLSKILGEELLIQLYPFSKNKTFFGKSFPDNKIIKLKIIENKYFPQLSLNKKPPYKWNNFPEKLHLKLLIEKLPNEDQDIAGLKGTKWDLVYDENKKITIKGDVQWKSTKINKNMNLDIWLEEDIFCSNEKFSLSILMPLQEVWLEPINLPIMESFLKLYHSSSIEKNIINYGNEPTTEKLGKFFKNIKIIDNVENKFHYLSKKWKKWANSITHKLLKKIIISRKNEILTITAATAFINRLHANNLYKINSEIEKLLKESIAIIKKHFPSLYLRDLILSEILITWYWNKFLINRR